MAQPVTDVVIGSRVHSGWAVLVTVAGPARAPEIVDRRRIVTMDTEMAGAKQPYHFAESMKLDAAREHLSTCAGISQRLAAEEFRSLISDLDSRGYRVGACAILTGAGRPLPELPQILASHALIHTAEGEFYRDVVRRACEGQGIPVRRLRERDLDDQVQDVFGDAAAATRHGIDGWGKFIGPPWTQDHKAAALAAAIVLHSLCGKQHTAISDPSVD